MTTNPNDTGFIHLRVRSEHSLGASVFKPFVIARHAKTHGLPAIGLADVGTLCGAFGFWQEAVGLGVRPIVGVEVPFRDGRVLFYARNRDGWNDLARLVTHAVGRNQRAAVIAHRGSNLVAVDCPCDGLVARAFNRGGSEAAIAAAVSLKRVLAPGCCFLGVGSEGLGGPSALDGEIRRVARTIGVDTALAFPVERPSQLISEAEALSAFPGFEDAIASTVRIAELCQESGVGLGPLTQFPGPWHLAQASAEDLFTSSVKGGLAARLQQLRDAGAEPDEAKYRGRLDTELALVKERHLEMNFLNDAHVATLFVTLGIVRGPGHGTMPSSLLLFVLGVTDIDPIAHGLHFELFFNPDRVALPDIVFEIETGRERELLAEIAEQFDEIDAMPATRAERSSDTGLAARHVASSTRLVVCGTGVFDRVAALLDNKAIRYMRADVLEEDAPMFGLWTIDVIPDDQLAAVRAALRANGVPDDKAPDFPLFLIDDATLIAQSEPGYSHPALAPFLAETNGVLYWQEQVLTIISEFSGMTLARADLLRRKLTGLSKNYDIEAEFVEAATSKGRAGVEAQEILDALRDGARRAPCCKSQGLASLLKDYWSR